MTSTPTTQSGQAGQWKPSASATPFNASAFQITQMLGLLSIAKLVQVQACTNTSAVSAVGTVDVLPLVNLLDGQGNSTPYPTLYKLPYFRVQGGTGAFISDPVKGDIGLAVFTDRDSSVVKRTKKVSNPGSYRRFDLADGMYLGGFLNAAPTQYFRFVTDGSGVPSGIEIIDVSGNKIVTTSAGMTLTDKNNNTVVMDTNGITINGVKFDRSQKVTGIVELTTSGQTNLGGGGTAVALAGGGTATKVKAT